MRRLSLFLGSLGWGARLQMLAVSIIVGCYAWADFHEGRGYVLAGVVFATWSLGWVLKPLVVYYPARTLKIWGAIGIAILAIYVLGQNQWWWRTFAAYVAREALMWLDLSCGYWFVSELRLHQQRQFDQPEESEISHE